MTCSYCPRTSTTDIYEYGVKYTNTMCDACADEARDDLAWLRVRFEALLAGGLSREYANDVMIKVYVPQRLERRPCGAGVSQ